MRARNIKPGFWENEDLGRLPHTDRLLFIGLWCLADREGKLEDRSDRIRHLLFGYDRRPVDVEKALCNLMSLHLITRYVIDGHGYISIPNFEKHQQPHPHEAKSKIPDTVECREMSLHVMKCHSDIRNPDSLNPDITIKDTDMSFRPNGAESDPPPNPATPPNTEEPKATPEDLVELWNQQAHVNLPRVKVLSERIRNHARARLAEYPDGSFWSGLLARMNKCPLLIGEVNNRNGSKPWRCTFEWIVNETNLSKVLNGNYDPAKR